MFHSIPVTVYVPFHTSHSVCSIPYQSQCMFHSIPVTVYVPFHTSHSVCSIPYQSQYMFHSIPVTVYVPFHTSHCVCSIPYQSQCMFHSIPVTVYVPFHTSHSVCSIPYQSQCMFHSIPVTVYVPFHTSHSVYSIPYQSQCMFHSIPVTVYIPFHTSHSVYSIPYQSLCMFHSIPVTVYVPFHTVVLGLFGLAKHCGYGALHDEMIRDRIVVGIRNVALSEKLQLKADLTLEEAIRQVGQSEAIKSQQPFLRTGCDMKVDNTPVAAVHKGKLWHRSNYGKQGRQHSRGANETESKTSPACTRCGKHPTHDRQHCPAKDVTCRKCGKRGHYQVVCRSARVSQVDTHTDLSEAFLGAIGDTTDNPWSVTIDVNGTQIELNIDTGAEVTVISEEAWRKVGQPALSPPDRTLRGPDTHKLPTTGQFTARLSKDEHKVEEEIYVVKGLHKPLLGRPAIDKLRLVSRVSSIDHTNQSPMEKFPNLFKGLGKLQGDYKIQLKEGAKPYAITTPRRVAIPLMKPVEQELQRMEALGGNCKSSRAHGMVCGHGCRPENQWQGSNMRGPDKPQSECSQRETPITCSGPNIGTVGRG